MIPANSSQALAYRYLHDEETPVPDGQQQSYVDCRESRNSTGEATEQDPEEEEDEPEASEPPVHRRRLEEPLDDFPVEALRFVQRETTRASNENVSDSMPTESRVSNDNVTMGDTTTTRSEEDERLTRTESRASVRGDNRSRSPSRRNDTMRALGDPTDRSLLEVWNRTSVTGRGRDVLAQNRAERSTVGIPSGCEATSTHD